MRVPTARGFPTGPGALPGVRMTAAPTARDLGAGNRVPNEQANADLSGAMREYADTLRVIDQREDTRTFLTVQAEMEKALIEQEAGWQRDRLGHGASGLTKDTAAWLAEQRPKWADKLTSPRQREAFDRRFPQLEISALRAASTFETIEGKKSEVAAAKASIATTIEVAAMNFADPVIVGNAKHQVLERAMLAGRAAGMSRDEIMISQLDYASQFHESIIAGKLKLSAPAAKEYYDANVGEMNATTRKRIGDAVATAGAVARAQTDVDDLMARNLPYEEAAAWIRKNRTGDDEAKGIIELKSRHVEIEAARERSQRTAADTAWKAYQDAGNPNRIDPQVWSAMDGKDRAAIVAHYDRRITEASTRASQAETRAWTREQRQSAQAVRAAAAKDRDRAGVYYDLRSLAMSDPAGFARLDLRRYSPELGPGQFESLIDIQSQASKPPDPKDPTSLDVASHNEQIRNLSTRIGLDKKQATEFEMAADQAVRAEQLARGKRLNQDERQVIYDQLLMPVRNPGASWLSGLFTTTRTYQVPPQDRGALVPADVPVKETETIAARLRAGGKPVTAAAIKEIYDEAQRVKAERGTK